MSGKERVAVNVKVLRASPVLSGRVGVERVSKCVSDWDGVSGVSEELPVGCGTLRSELTTAACDDRFIKHVHEHLPQSRHTVTCVDKEVVPNYCFSSKSVFYFGRTDFPFFVRFLRFCVSQSQVICLTKEEDHSGHIRERFVVDHELHAAIGWDNQGKPHVHGVRIVIESTHSPRMFRFVTAYPLDLYTRTQYDRLHNPYVLITPDPSYWERRARAELEYERNCVEDW